MTFILPRTLVRAFQCGTGAALLLSLALLAAFGATAVPGRAGDPATPRYRVTDLGLVGGKVFRPQDINESGQVAGVGVNSISNSLGVIWTPDQPNGVTGTSITIQPPAGNTSSELKAINDDGVAVGLATEEGNWGVGFYWKNGVSTALHSGSPPPAEYTVGAAYDINNEGLIVGETGGPGRTNGAAYWSDSGSGELGGLAGGSFAFSVNDNGLIVGKSGGPDFTNHAVKWSGPMATDLNPAGFNSGEAVAVNNLGHAVGSAWKDGIQHGFLWNGNAVDLGNMGLSNANCSPDDINDSDQIVGNITQPGVGNHPFLYENGVMVDLNTLIGPDAGFRITQAFGINNAGQIVGLGTPVGGFGTGVLLTPLSLIPADLAVTLNAAPSPAFVGRELTYTGTVTNNGPESATGATAVFTLPNAVDLVSTMPAATRDGNTLTFDLGSLTDGQEVDLEIIVTPTAVGALSARLEASAPEHDPVAGNNAVTRNVNAVVPAADLSVAFPAISGPVFLGQDLTYTGSVKNNGPHTATEAKGIFTLPAGVDLVSTTPSATREGDVLTFDLGTLVDEAVANLQIIVRPTTPGTLTARLQASARETDTNAGNNSVTRSVTARSQAADVSVTGTATPSTVLVGQTVTYKFTVKNSGPDPATGVRLGQTLAVDGTDLRFESIQTSKGTTRRDGANIFAEIGALAKNETALVTILAVAVGPTDGPLVRSGIVVSTETDPNLENNVAGPPVTVNPASQPNLFGHWDLLQVKRKGKGKKLKYHVNATAKITNDGNAGAGASKLRFFLSTDRTRSKNDVPLTVKVNGKELPVEIPINALAAGASQTIPVSGIKVSKKDYVAKLKGRFLLGVVDFGGTVAESNESDNVFPKKGDKANPL